MRKGILAALVIAGVVFAVLSAMWWQAQAIVDTPATVAITLREMAFSPGRIEVPAGAVSVRIINAGSLEHDFSVDALQISPNVRPGSTVEYSFVAAPGEYPVYCSLPGHREAGMAGTLVVVP